MRELGQSTSDILSRPFRGAGSQSFLHELLRFLQITDLAERGVGFGGIRTHRSVNFRKCTPAEIMAATPAILAFFAGEAYTGESAELQILALARSLVQQRSGRFVQLPSGRGVFEDRFLQHVLVEVVAARPYTRWQVEFLLLLLGRRTAGEDVRKNGLQQLGAGIVEEPVERGIAVAVSEGEPFLLQDLDAGNRGISYCRKHPLFEWMLLGSPLRRKLGM